MQGTNFEELPKWRYCVRCAREFLVSPASEGLHAGAANAVSVTGTVWPLAT